jgi:PhnB protein
VKFRPEGSPTVIPRIIVRDVENLVKFIRDVFGAVGEHRPGTPAQMRLGESIVMVSGEGGERDLMPAFLYVYVADTDATFRRACEAGAVALERPADMPYGDRRAMVRDAWGNIWQIATRH